MNSVRVLHIDDEPDIREVVEISLGLDPDFETRSCSSGPEALTLVTHWLPNIILLDVMMPIMDGPATLALLRESVTTADIPVVFMTARAQSREIELFRSLGAAAVIQKPFDPMKLAASVRTHIDFMDVQLRALNNDFRARLDEDASALARHQAALDDGTAEPGTRRKSGTSHIDWPEPAVSSISKKSAAPPRQLRMPLFSVLMPLTRATGSSPLLIVCSPRLKWLANCETGRLRWRLRVGLNSPRRRWGGAFKALLVLIWFIAPLSPAHAQRFDGFNVVLDPGHAFGSASERRPPWSPRVHLGASVDRRHSVPVAGEPIESGYQVRQRHVRRDIARGDPAGAPVWVFPSWSSRTSGCPKAGPARSSRSPSRTGRLGSRVTDGELERIAKIAAEEGAEALAIGTELSRTTQRPEWKQLIATARAGVSADAVLYRPQYRRGRGRRRSGRYSMRSGYRSIRRSAPTTREPRRLATMHDVAEHLDVLSSRFGQTRSWSAKSGLRSAKGAAAKPWESAEERVAPAAPQLQADVIADWMAVLNRPSVHGVMIWRWFTDAGPAASPTPISRYRASRRKPCCPARGRRHLRQALNQNLYHAPTTSPFSCNALRPQ